MTDIPYLDRLRHDLMTGIERRRRRRTMARRIAVVAAPAAIAAVVVGATVPGGSSPALAIERQGEWIVLRIADVSASEAEMERELRDAGIEAEIRLVPVTDALVGRWACVAEIADDAPAGGDPDGRGPLGREYRVRLNEIRYDANVVEIRRDFAQTTQDGGFVFVAGRTAANGERASASPCAELVPAARG